MRAGCGPHVHWGHANGKRLRLGREGPAKATNQEAGGPHWHRPPPSSWAWRQGHLTDTTRRPSCSRSSIRFWPRIIPGGQTTHTRPDAAPALRLPQRVKRRLLRRTAAWLRDEGSNLDLRLQAGVLPLDDPGGRATGIGRGAAPLQPLSPLKKKAARRVGSRCKAPGGLTHF